MNELPLSVFGALLVAISGPALAYASITGHLWVGLFPLPDTFAPERITRSDNPRRYYWHLFWHCAGFLAGLCLLAL